MINVNRCVIANLLPIIRLIAAQMRKVKVEYGKKKCCVSHISMSKSWRDLWSLVKVHAAEIKWGQQKEFKQLSQRQPLCGNVGLFSLYLSRVWKLFCVTFHWISACFRYQLGSSRPSRLQCFGAGSLGWRSYVPAGPGPRWSTGLIAFDRCETCDRMTRIPASAADDRVPVLWWSSAHCWWVSDPAWDWPVLQILHLLRSLIMRFGSPI